MSFNLGRDLFLHSNHTDYKQLPLEDEFRVCDTGPIALFPF